jgi:PAS domain S-box-containing protein
MTQRRKIAIAYLFAVPVVLIIVLFEQSTLIRVAGVGNEMAHAAEVLQITEGLPAALKRAEAAARRYIAAGDNAYMTSYQDAVSEVQNDIRRVRDLTKSDTTAQAPLQKLEPLITKRLGMLQQAMASRAKPGSPADKQATLDTEGQKLDNDIEKAIQDLQTAQQIRLQQQRQNGVWSVRIAKAVNTFGGILAVWLVGLAAFLLFHDEKARKWAGVERRVHTKVLETLPLGVCLTSHTGLILYANPAEEDMFGYDPGQLVGSNVSVLHGFGPGDDTGTLNKIIERLDSGLIWSGELPARRKDGTTHKTFVWVRNMEIPGTLYRVFIHNMS